MNYIEADKLNSLFVIDSDLARLAILESSDGGLKLLHHLPPNIKDYMLNEIKRCLGKALDISIDKLLISGLKSFQEVIQAGAKTRQPGNPPEVLVNLSAFTLESNHNPSIEIGANGRTIATVPLKVSAKISFEGAIAKICGGKLMEIAAGNSQASGEISISEINITKTRTKKANLPGILKLGDGIDLMS
jgi:hypothetical protein